MFKIFISLMLLFPLMSYASEESRELGTYTKIVHAKFISVNTNQTLSLLMEGKEYPVKIAYLRIPIQGEPYYEAATTVIDAYFKKSPWVQAHLTGQKFFNGTIAAFINDSSNVSLNAILLADGLAIPSNDALMQEDILAISKKAASQKKGIWSSETAYNKLTVNPFLPAIQKFKRDTDIAMSVADKYVVVDVEKRQFYPGVCYPLFKMKGRKVSIYVDIERLKKLGYKEVTRCD